MRKFYLFTLALLSAVGAWAQQVSFDAQKWYLITEVSTGKYVASRTSATGAEGSFGMMADGAIGDLFRITERGSGFVLTNAEGKSLGTNDKDSWNTTERETVWTIENSDGSYTLKATRAGDTGDTYLNYQTGHPNSIYVDGSNSAESDGYKIHFQITEATDYATVKYNYTLNGTIKKTFEIVVANGAMYPTLKGLPMYVSAARPEGVVNTTEASNGIIIKSVSCTQNLPFKAFNSVNAISKWYYVKMHSNSTRTRYIREAASVISFPWSENGTEDNQIFENDNHDSALWGFVGDAFGMKLVSKSGRVVVFTGSGVASFANSEAEGTNFVLTANAYNSNDWFCMKHPTQTQYLNANAANQNVSNYNQNDNGSSMQVEENVNDLVSQMVGLTPFDIPEGSIVQGPSEFANPTEINEAISDFTTESVANGTLLDKRAFLHSSNGQKLINYVKQVATYGDLATINFTMKAQYGTLIMPCPSRAVTGLKTYKCSAVGNDNVVTLTPNGTNGGGDLAENVPYIIEATSDANKFTIIGWDKGSRAKHTEGYLTGVLTKDGATITGNSYVLAKTKTGDKVGFFKVIGNDVECPQYKCYLTVPESTARAFYFSSDDVETSINAVEAEETTPANAAIYDLSGRRVQSAKAGLYIVNGKKVIK